VPLFSLVCFASAGAIGLAVPFWFGWLFSAAFVGFGLLLASGAVRAWRGRVVTLVADPRARELHCVDGLHRWSPTHTTRFPLDSIFTIELTRISAGTDEGPPFAVQVRDGSARGADLALQRRSRGRARRTPHARAPRLAAQRVRRERRGLSETCIARPRGTNAADTAGLDAQRTDREAERDRHAASSSHRVAAALLSGAPPSPRYSAPTQRDLCPIKIRSVSLLGAHRLHVMGRRRAKQIEIDYRTHGGARAGAGRKPAGDKAGVRHRRRGKLGGAAPVLVTMKLLAGVANLRNQRRFGLVLRALRSASERLDTRIVEFSVQHDHVHLVVETTDACALSRAMQGLAVRLARALNRSLGRRGKVFKERFHHRVLGTPRQVRNALAYVLCNGRQGL